jgi:hypothetical protein
MEEAFTDWHPAVTNSGFFLGAVIYVAVDVFEDRYTQCQRRSRTHGKPVLPPTVYVTHERDRTFHRDSR